MGCVFSQVVNEQKSVQTIFQNQFKGQVEKKQSQIELFEFHHRLKHQKTEIFQDSDNIKNKFPQAQILDQKNDQAIEKSEPRDLKRYFVKKEIPKYFHAQISKSFEHRHLTSSGIDNLPFSQIKQLKSLDQQLQVDFIQYNFQYIQDKPQSLTMTDSPEQIIKLVWDHSIYLLTSQTNQLTLQQILKLEKNFLSSILCFKNLEDAQKFYINGNYQNIKVLCHFKDKYAGQKIVDQEVSGKQIFYFDNLFSEKLGNLIKQIENRSSQRFKKNEYAKFISISEQTQITKVRIKVMYAMINQETNKSELVDEMIKLLELAAAFRKQEKKLNLSQLKKDLLQKSPKIQNIVQWYTKQSFLQILISILLREIRNPSEIYCLQPYIKELFLAIRKLHKRSKMKSLTCYCGGSGTDIELQSLKSSVGQIVQNLNFMSAYQKIEVAEKFVTNLLFLIKVSQKTKNTFGFADVTCYSLYNDSSEILFNPLNFFKIVGFNEKIIDGKTVFVFELYYAPSAKENAYLQNYEKSMENVDCIEKILLGQSEKRVAKFWQKHRQLFGVQKNKGQVNFKIKNIQVKVTQQILQNLKLKNTNIKKQMSLFSPGQQKYHLLKEQKSQLQQYNFQYIQNNPGSLTMTKPPFQLFKLLINQPVYLLISEQPIQQSIPTSSKNLSSKFIHFASVQSANEAILKENHQNIHILCSLSLSIEVSNAFSLQNQVKKISCFTQSKTYDKMKIQGKLGPKFVKCSDSLEQLMEHLLQNKTKNYVKNQYLNFIDINNEAGKSNTLIKTMYAMINQETNSAQLIDEMIKLAKLTGFEKDNHLQQFRRDLLESSPLSKIVQWYTRDSFVYRLINSLLGAAGHPSEIYCTQPYIKRLFNAIREMHKESKMNSFTCFRGGFISQKQLQCLSFKVGLIVQNLSFMSTSLNQEVAERFSNNVFFIIHVQENQQENFGFSCISKHSIFEDEVEVLFNPLNFFRIIKNYQKIINGHQKTVFELTLTPFKKSFIPMKSYHSQMSSVKNFGDVLIFYSKFLEGSEQFWQKHSQICTERFDILYNLESRAATYINRGKFQKALPLLNRSEDQICKQLERTKSLENQQSVQIQRKKNETNNNGLNIYQFYYVRALENFGNAYSKMGLFKKSLSFLQKGLVIRKKYFDIDPSSYVNILISISSNYNLMGQYQKSIQVSNLCQQITKKYLGTDHPFYTVSLKLLGYLYHTIGQHIKSFQYLQKCEETWRKSLGIDNPLYLTNLADIGQFYYKTKQYNLSLEYFLKCEALLKKSVGLDHPNYANILNSIGLVYTAIGQYQKSLQLLEASLQIIRTNGGQHLSYAATLYNIGSAYEMMRQFNRSLQYYKRSEELSRRILGDNHPKYACTLNNIGSTYMQMGQYNKSLQYYKKCERIWQKQMGDPSDYATILNNIGYVYKKMECYQKSLQYYVKCQRICEKYLGKNHQYYEITLNNINKVRAII